LVHGSSGLFGWGELAVPLATPAFAIPDRAMSPWANKRAESLPIPRLVGDD
jgi:hypothetical protein